ncbi:hypothetical protein [Corynebacterium crudilactis]|uniref:Uncharacterized protein n=1 Tax=Corynebacterium crudilactis TaxID=1652495 RepID=A0A172QUW2_9CORY|nr:hypothetical protein [Corynebacterium crudilactis]ANE04492.1 hypothetical protein ccrud_09955 [Corynebacterium crudilactis]
MHSLDLSGITAGLQALPVETIVQALPQIVVLALPRIQPQDMLNLSSSPLSQLSLDPTNFLEIRLPRIIERLTFEAVGASGYVLHLVTPRGGAELNVIAAGACHA